MFKFTFFKRRTFFVPLLCLLVINSVKAQSFSIYCSNTGVNFSTFDSKGNLYTTDRNGAKVYKVTPAGASSVFVGSGLSQPYGIITDDSDNVFVSNSTSGVINKITPQGVMTVFATLVSNSGPRGLVIDKSHNIYVACYGDGNVYKITEQGAVSIYFASIGGGPTGLSFDHAGNLYVASINSNLVTRITPDSSKSIYLSGISGAANIVFDAVGNCYVAAYSGGAIIKYDSRGKNPVTLYSMTRPLSLIMDAKDNLYFASYAGNVTYKVVFTPSATITTATDTICSTSAVTFKAKSINGGAAPLYQWKVNGTNVGVNSSDSTYVLQNAKTNDSVSCILTSNAALVNARNVTVIDNTQNGTVSANTSVVTDINTIKKNACIFKTAAINKFSLDSISLILKSYNVAATNKVAISLFDVDAISGMPTGSALKLDTAGIVLNNSYSYVTLPLSGWSLLPDTKYAIVINSVDSTLSRSTLMGNPSYLGSEGFTFLSAFTSINGGVSWVASTQNNFALQIFATKEINTVSSNSIVIKVKPTISGNIYCVGKGAVVANVTTTLSGSITAKDSGYSSYNFSCLTPGGNYTLKPSKNNDVNKANGVTTLDMTLIQSHILGKILLNSPYKIIAADVNGDGKITTLDIVYMKRMILGLDTTFNNSSTSEKRLWAFVDSSYSFPDSTNPFPFKDSISFNGLNAAKRNQTFIGIKLGDVNWDWNPALARMPKASFLKPENFVNETLEDAVDKH